MDARTYLVGTWEVSLLPSATGGAAKVKAKAERRNVRQGEIRCDDISHEASEQSMGAHVAELVERSVAPKGKPCSPTRTGLSAGYCVSHGMDRLRLRVGLPTC